ncbi:hypothetical protein LV83_03791 [Algoriphagus yeomjeoni]|uniref:Uncharacterized protein n=1 Tax=Algoriphagus yeomjeoni TaxID=291403 RepID=A0A327P0N9_9BACT|nr:hypothetical protein LV83_03791 [Algoriphagus yeomjeoni]
MKFWVKLNWVFYSECQRHDQYYKIDLQQIFIRKKTSLSLLNQIFTSQNTQFLQIILNTFRNSLVFKIINLTFVPSIRHRTIFRAVNSLLSLVGIFIRTEWQGN